MKARLFTLGCAILLLASCSKQTDTFPDPLKETPPLESSKDYEQFTIKQGEQFCDKNGYLPVDVSEMAFKVKFDSSAIYTTKDPKNQKDVNKLFGFSDNNAAHHDFSARFGWRWSNNALRLFAYTYNAGVLGIKEMGTVEIGTENDCSIKVAGETYIFTLNGVSASMLRSSTTATGSGYQLYPYFGGNEMAPHDIRILIKQL